MKVNTIFKEPLLHFSIAGAMLFGAHTWLNRSEADDQSERTVRITASNVRWLSDTWQRQWDRPPTESELQGLVTDYLKEELLSREARTIGLDENDTIVRRRLAQKMQFLVQDIARAAEPADTELRQVYEAHPDRYQHPARVSFSQVFFKTEPAARRALADQPSHNVDGEGVMLEREHAGVDEHTVASVFGLAFAGKVFSLEPGKWQGPVPSSYGFHLVLVTEREPTRRRSFADARGEVLEEWHREQQAIANQQFFASLLEKYDVMVDASVSPISLGREVTR